MLRDVFYYGNKPNVHPREQFAESLEDARRQATTRDFWIINEFCDYRNFDWDFDFEFLPDEDVWAEDHNNVWPSQHQKDSGTWLCPKEHSDLIVYRGDVNPVTRKNLKSEYWVNVELIDQLKFDFSWHPDPTDPPYIYQFGTQWQRTGGPRYVMAGATDIKYITTQIALRLPSTENWNIIHDVVDFDFSWHPDEVEESYRHVFGNQWHSAEIMPTIEYVVPGATHSKFVHHITPKLTVDMTNWVIPEDLDTTEFDFSWRPEPGSPLYIYEFATQWQKTGGPQYVMPGATEKNYIDVQKAKKLPSLTNWTVPNNIDVSGFDFSWHPDDTNPDYIYVFATQWAFSGGPVYTVPGATELKYVDDQIAISLPNMENWVYDSSEIDVDSFDFSWHPYVEDQPYIYEFGTQWQPNGGPRYITPGADSSSPTKYIDTRIIKATRLPNRSHWELLEPIDESQFDFSWHPDNTAPALIYAWGNQWNESVDKISVQYIVPGATDYQYMEGRAVRVADKSKWIVPDNIDDSEFDYTWEPSPAAPPYIYEFATQWQKTGGPQYVVDNATEKTYLDFQKVTRLPSNENWTVPENIDPAGFDFSWHPDATNPNYNYIFATQWAFSGGPIYTVPGATESKYVEDQTAKALPDKTNWVYDENEIDIDTFDFSWHPYVEDQPYIYQFGTQHQKTGGPRYITPGADSSSPTKYIDTRIIKATRLPNKHNPHWNELYDVSDFDWSWHPDDTDEPYIYIFGNNWHSAEAMPTVEYALPGAKSIKYVHDVVATLSVDMTNWVVPDNIDVSSFDFRWRPEPGSPNFIYEFATQWQKTGGPQYVMPGATEKKYIDLQKANRVASKINWTTPSYIDDTTFDYSWHPDDTAPPYVYVFSTQWSFSGGPVYTVPGATEIKYVEDQTAKALPDHTNWVYDNSLIDASSFDFSWHPYVEDQPYIYQFGTQWQKTGGPQYVTPGADTNSPIKYIDTRILKAKRVPNKSKFTVPAELIVKDFDWSWHPDDTAPPYIYVFGNQWYPAGEMPTVEYHVNGATSREYISDTVATLGKNMSNWEIPNGVDVSTFDFSWLPHPDAPPYIYQFGTTLDPTDGPIYTTPNNNGETIKVPRVELEEVEEIVVGQYYVETTLEDLVAKHPDEIFWALNKDIDYSEFDFNWLPSIEQAEYVHVFGSSESEMTQTYLVNGPMWTKGYRDLNWVEDTKLDDKTLYKLFKKADIFFVDKSNPESADRFEALRAKFGTQIQKTRYLNSWVDTINRCINRATTEMVWILNSELDYSDFDFEYYPNPWQMKMVQVFGTQWSHWGTTFMVNRETFKEDTKYIKIIEHLSNLNFVKEHRAKATACVHDIVMIDHGNKEITSVSEQVEQRAGRTLLTTINYDDSYLNTLKNYVKKLPERKEHYLWICSSVCDYSQFDFTYVCDPFAKDNLHVFPSGTQKFGDTFFIDVNKTKEIIDEMEKLEEYHKVNFNSAVKTTRLPEPIIVTSDDTHVNAVTKVTGFPYVTFITADNVDIEAPAIEPINLWAPDTKNIIITSTGATRIIVPTEAAGIVNRELYDYPYIKRAPKLIKSNPMDIVFLSNGETGADDNWEHLLNVTKGLPNRVVRVDGVNGRAAAYHAAAEASETPWMFTVFAKLKVSPKFDWNWQPDRMQVPKHYIFHAKNPVNGLTYGHQAMIAYNKKLTLANEGRGLDFTLDDEHETVPLISGTAMYNTDPFSTWRTAFREVLKLKADDSEESRVRLDTWLNKADGEFGQFSIKGAVDADEYFDEVDGDFDALKLSYEWAWLRDRFDKM